MMKLTYAVLPILLSQLGLCFGAICVVPDGHTDPEVISPTKHQPSGGHICTVADFYEVIVKRCETRYCCGVGCSCQDDIYEGSGECSGNFTELSCYVEHKDTYWERKECCEGYEENANSICVEADVDECRTSTHGCSQMCVNTVSSYRCECNPGYQLHTDGRTCNDANECATNNGGCTQRCVNSVGSYRCECNNGYQLDSGDLHTCVDINECVSNSGGCTQRCVNSEGSYICECNTGYQLNSGDLQTCVDVNECASNNGGCTHTCVNSEGSYLCECNQGYQLDSTNQSACVDINECESNNGGCTQRCVNSEGSYRCECNTGYQLNSGDPHTCVDTNECASNNGGCSQRCVNSNGSYRCECTNGYQLDSGDLHSCVGDAGHCVTNCSGLPAGNYQSCSGCHVYASCDAVGNLFDNRSCPGGLVWDDNRKRCGWTSDTCG